MRSGGVVELQEAPVPLFQLCEGPTPPEPVELFRVDPVLRSTFLLKWGLRGRMQRCRIPAALQARVNGWRRTARSEAVFGAPVYQFVKVASLSVWTTWRRNGNFWQIVVRNARAALLVSAGANRTTRSRVQSSIAVYWYTCRPSTRYGTYLISTCTQLPGRDMT